MCITLLNRKSVLRKHTFVRTAISVLASVSLALMLFFQGCSTGVSRDVLSVHSSFISYIEKADLQAVIRHMKLGVPRTVLKSVVQKAPGRLEWPLRIPDAEAFLEFSLGYLRNSGTVRGSVEARITIISGEDRRLAARKYFSIPNSGTLNERIDERLPLADYRGKEITIVFESLATGIDAGSVDIIWGNPAIYIKEETRLPNIVLICLDTLRCDHVESYNADCDLTPHLQRLAQDGIVFENAISQSPWTLPSVASVLTGLYPSVHGAGKRTPLGDEVSQEEVDELISNGVIVRRGSIMSGLRSQVKTLPEMLGDKYLCHMANSNVLLSTGSNVINRFDSYYDRAIEGYQVDTNVKEWLGENRDKLFFLYAHYLEPHQWPFMFRDRTHIDPGEDKELANKTYDEMVKLGDFFVGEIIEKLKDLDIYDSSLIIFYSDHGEHFWDNRSKDVVGHGTTLSDLLLHVPLIIKLPHSEHAGQRVSDYVKLTDIFNTIAVAAEVQLDDSLTGQNISLLDAVANRNPDQNDCRIISEFMFGGHERLSIQMGGYRLVHNFNTDVSELVDAVTDKHLNVGGSRQLQRIWRELKDTMDSYLKFVSGLEFDDEEIRLDEEGREQLKNLGYLN